MKDKYILIAYRSNGEVRRGGHIRDTSDSAHHVYASPNAEKIAKVWANLTWGKRKEWSHNDWEFTLFINGVLMLGSIESEPYVVTDVQNNLRKKLQKLEILVGKEHARLKTLQEQKDLAASYDADYH